MKQIKSWAQYYVDLMTKLGLVRFSMFLATAIIVLAVSIQMGVTLFLRGTVDIQSTPAKGSTFRIHLPLTLAINSINRSMGQPDLYPFVLSEPVIGKLHYIHGLIRS